MYSTKGGHLRTGIREPRRKKPPPFDMIDVIHATSIRVNAS